MLPFFGFDESKIVEKLAGKLKEKVKIYFIAIGSEENYSYLKQLMESLKRIENLEVEELNITEAKNKGIDLIGTPAITFEGYENLIYFGSPMEFELDPFLNMILMVSNKYTGFDEKIKEKLKEVKDAEVLVFITPQCPFCPAAVELCAKLAIENKNIKVKIIEAYEFQQFAMMYNIRMVPTIVIRKEGKEKEIYGTPSEIELIGKLLE